MKKPKVTSKIHEPSNQAKGKEGNQKTKTRSRWRLGTGGNNSGVIGLKNPPSLLLSQVKQKDGKTH